MWRANFLVNQAQMDLEDVAFLKSSNNFKLFDFKINQKQEHLKYIN